MVIDYQTLKEEIIGLIKDKKVMVLATSADNRVTARNVSYVVIDLKIYFQTDKTFLKYSQIIANPNVALCVDNIQIAGSAKIKGHPFIEDNKEFIAVFKQVHAGSYNNYSHMGNEVVVEIEPKFITLWKYENGQPLREFLDIESSKAYREYYDNSK